MNPQKRFSKQNQNYLINTINCINVYLICIEIQTFTSNMLDLDKGGIIIGNFLQQESHMAVECCLALLVQEILLLWIVGIQNPAPPL